MSDAEPSNTWRWIAASIVLAGSAFVAACGGAAPPPPPPPEASIECCVDERWEEPPPEIGQTPPDRPAPPDALEPFTPDDIDD